MSFGEITAEAALAVAKAVKHKDQLKKLDLNGNTHPLSYRDQSVLLILRMIKCVRVCARVGNCIGEEGCESLRELMQSMKMGDLLATLRYIHNNTVNIIR